MAREAFYQAIIIKRQPYGEGDEILTVFTKEAGKLRVLAKATKMPKSKMRHALQTLFLTDLTVTSVSALPKVIGATAVAVFPKLREKLDAVNMAFYASELLLKFTADEHKNERLFGLVKDFFSFLDSAPVANLNAGLAKFKIGFLESVGLGIHFDASEKNNPEMAFSNARGGFVFGAEASGQRRVNPLSFQQFLEIKNASFSQLFTQEPMRDIQELQDLLSNFIVYHLERDIKSEKYLKGRNVV